MRSFCSKDEAMGCRDVVSHKPFFEKVVSRLRKKLDYVVTTISVILEHSLSVYDVTKNWKRNMEGFHTILHQIEVCKPEQFQRVRLDNR